MKYLDEVKVLKDCEEYNKFGVFSESIGTIISAQIIDNTFLVVFSDSSGKDYALTPIKIEDLEVVASSDIKDDAILNDLPNKNPLFWCKVENGFILNLNGDRKNKFPYKY